MRHRRRHQEGLGGDLRGDRGEGGRPRREDRRHATSPPSSSARSWRATAASSGRSVSPSARRSTRASSSSTAAPTRCRSRSRRSRWRRRRRRSPNTAPPIRARRSATFSAPRSSAPPKSRGEKPRRSQVATIRSGRRIAMHAELPWSRHAARQRAPCARFIEERAMSLDADTIVDRRRMRRKLTFWRVLAILVAIGAVVAVGAALRVPGTGHADRRARRLDCARHHHRPHPRRPGAGGGAGAAGQVARARRDRAHQQPRRHHLGLRAAARFAARG